jgi:hypothetical protein
MKPTRKKITIVIEKTKTGFSAFAEDYPIFTTAKAIPQLIGNTIEATNFIFRRSEKSNNTRKD